MTWTYVGRYKTDSYNVRRNKNDDPEPLPLEFYCVKSRAVEITMPTMNGVKGLGMAVLLRAIGDGCNAEWLEAIKRAYLPDMDLPEGMLQKLPRKVIQTDNGLDYREKPSNEFYPVSSALPRFSFEWSFGMVPSLCRMVLL